MEGKGGRKSSEVNMRRGRNLKMVVLDVGPNLLESLGPKNLLNVADGLHLQRDFAWLHYTPNFWGGREALTPKPRSATSSLPPLAGLSPLSIFMSHHHREVTLTARVGHWQAMVSCIPRYRETCVPWCTTIHQF